MKIAALYARASGERQRDDNTIASQTEALIAYAEDHGYSVAPDMIIEDDGYSGAVLERPGLERVRDLAAEGRIDTVLVHAPDRLSRRYAYQVLIIEELARQGVETVFLRAPSMETPEDHLLVQFQGMIAEYERAQILERSRRGKRHRARRGEIAVLGGAPYGYRYHKKTPDSDAFYEIVEPQASVVREVYRYYTCDHMSIGAITCRLNERAVPTSTGRSRWERSTVWAMLRNPAYKGKACFGKTRQMPRKCVTRPLRLRRGVASGTTGGHEKPREEWIEIPVPAIVSEETFALAEERLEMNKIHPPRRTKTPSLVQGLVSCGKCGYALSRTSARTSARKISYYRCLGSDSWRHLNGPVCDSRPVRQDLLDDVVWGEVVRLLEDPALIGAEIDRRLQAARASDPNQQRENDLRHRLIRVRKSIDRLVNAYQEELITIDELRDRTPELRRQDQALNRELQSAVDRAKDREIYLRLAETRTGFLARLHSSAETLDIAERQRIVRLIVKEVLVTEDKITIRHSIPISGSPTGGPDPSKPGNHSTEGEGYLLRSGRHLTPAQQPLHAALHTGLENAGLRPALPGGDRELRGRPVRARQGPGGGNADGGQAAHGRSEAAGQRTGNPMPAVPGGAFGVSGLSHRTQLPPLRGGVVHRHLPQQGERPEHLPQDQRNDGERARLAAIGGHGGTLEPDYDRMGELLLPRAGHTGLLRGQPTRRQAAAPVALSKAQDEARDIRAFPGKQAV